MKCVCSANRKREQNATKNIQKQKEKKTKKNNMKRRACAEPSNLKQQ